MTNSHSGYPEEDAAVRRAREIVADLVRQLGDEAIPPRARASLAGQLAAELQRLEFEARSDERAECAQVVAQVFPPAHPCRRDAEEAIRRIRARDTQP